MTDLSPYSSLYDLHRRHFDVVASTPIEAVALRERLAEMGWLDWIDDHRGGQLVAARVGNRPDGWMDRFVRDARMATAWRDSLVGYADRGDREFDIHYGTPTVRITQRMTRWWEGPEGNVTAATLGDGSMMLRRRTRGEFARGGDSPDRPSWARIAPGGSLGKVPLGDIADWLDMDYPLVSRLLPRREPGPSIGHVQSVIGELFDVAQRVRGPLDDGLDTAVHITTGRPTLRTRLGRAAISGGPVFADLIDLCSYLGEETVTVAMAGEVADRLERAGHLRWHRDGTGCSPTSSLPEYRQAANREVFAAGYRKAALERASSTMAARRRVRQAGPTLGV